MMEASQWPRLGAGLGLRPVHHHDVLTADHPLAWFEVITENVLGAGGNPRRVLHAVRERWPVVLHGVSLAIGGPNPIDEDFLDQLLALGREFEPAWISDHLCWGGLGAHRAHDLWPLPLHEETLDHVTSRVHHVQERLKRPLVLENVSSYVTFEDSTMDEGTFLAELVRRTGCGLLVDLNNLVVNRHNHGHDPVAFLEAVPLGAVAQFHMAGHEVHPTHRIDTHDHPIDEETWSLFERAVERFGPVATSIEWDDHIPPLPDLFPSVRRIKDTLEPGAR